MQSGKVKTIHPYTMLHVKTQLSPRYPFAHPFASSLGGSDNIISFTSSRYNKRPLIVQGAGAGADVTAMGVVADCLRVVERLL